MKNKNLLIMTGVIIIVAVMTTTSTINTFAISPYESGYDHGQEDCDDLKNNVPIKDIYIFKSEYGPEHHTQNFMNGFYDGWENEGCDSHDLVDTLYPDNNNNNNNNNVDIAIDDSNFDDHSNQQDTSQNANINQVGQCPRVLLNGDCVLGQSQDISNDFAAANRND